MVKRKYVFIPSSFLVMNVCNQGKTLCSPCIIEPIGGLYSEPDKSIPHNQNVTITASLFISLHLHLDRPNFSLLSIFFFITMNVLCTSPSLSWALHENWYHSPYCYIPQPPTNFVKSANRISIIKYFPKDGTYSNVANICL